MPIQTFPGVPIDILRQIFEFASASSASTGLTLTLVSTHIRHWTLPIIYRNVVLSSSRAVTLFLETIATSAASKLTPAIPLCSRVKNLGVFALGPLPAIEQIISLCDNIESLACGFSLHAYLLSNHQMLPRVSCKKHFLGPSCRDGIPFHLISPQTTHFHAQLSLEDFHSILEICNYVSAITHLAISVPVSSKDAVEIIESTTSALLDSSSPLEFLLIQVMGTKGSEIAEVINARNKTRMELAGVQDGFRVVAIRAPTSVVRQWEKMVISSADLWEDAERKVNQKRW
ncbi:uncharacterized protein EV420DRAFT_1267278 [Desarmillaria tabescens]|uniref:Uncharacterized protein n=1 Tax=Armillaria tabescens TaxID=1929756 RepID=A0AA39T331_ARMTA|nr:uncharacterized protein EV420DRAFT_1267278 [Desarmillaria tabescens]KAK0460976.1 hypothetical protein EV420DRAFT_1267278 [Desarmillaria tabescens]